jgi:septum formation protein
MNFFKKLQQFDIILASQSPRRSELLQQAGINFRVISRSISEHFPEGLTPEEVVRTLCLEKSYAFSKELEDPRVLVITADTIVVKGSKILNKAADEKQATAMLEFLSGGWHEVHTGVCIRQAQKTIVFHETTRVLFRHLDAEEISYYIRNYKPFDKAGAYGIQEWIGKVGISRLEGSYSNVVGLPVERLFVELKKFVQS